jgi:hypothetical protein
MRLLLKFTLVVACALPLISWGLPVMNIPCTGKANGQIRDHNELVHKVMVIGDADRYTDEEFAAKENIPLNQLKEATGATVPITCRGQKMEYVGTANVTIKENTIVTAAHIFQGGCTKERTIPATSCFVQVGNQSYKVKRSLAQGYTCPLSQEYHGTTDWAVLELDRDIPGIKPYAVDFTPFENLKRDRGDMISIGYSNDFHRQGADGKWSNPRHVGRCKMNDYNLRFEEKYGLSDCDSAQGASGGPILSPELGSIKLRGISIANTDRIDKESAEAARAAKEERREFRREYSPSRGSSGHLLITGRFAEALRQVEASSPKAPVQSTSGKSNGDSI